MFFIQNYCHYILQYIGVTARLPPVTKIVEFTNNFLVSVHFLVLQYALLWHLHVLV